MKRLALALVLLTGCAEALPEVGSALEKVSDTASEATKAYEQIKEARALLESMYTQVCIPPVVAEAAVPCAKVRVALDASGKAEAKTFEALSIAVDSINAAIAAYNVVNEAADAE